MSARERRPLTGRSNRSDYLSQNELKANHSVSSSTNKQSQSLAQSSVTPSMIAKWNDTLAVSRDFSPRDPNVKPVKPYPPIFPQSRFPTIPPYEEDPVPRRKRPLTCPSNWVEDSVKPHAFDPSALTSDLDPQDKQKYCREFIERNRDKLWQYNMDYRTKTPRTLCEELTEDRNFVAIMTQHHRKEKALNLSNSDMIRNDILSHENSFADARTRDPFSASLSTTRSERQRKVESLFQPTLHEQSKHRRGYEHMPEYGNFSRFNSILKQNSGSVLKR